MRRQWDMACRSMNLEFTSKPGVSPGGYHHEFMVIDHWLSPETRPSHFQTLVCLAQFSRDGTECGEPQGGFDGILSESQPLDQCWPTAPPTPPPQPPLLMADRLTWKGD